MRTEVWSREHGGGESQQIAFNVGEREVVEVTYDVLTRLLKESGWSFFDMKLGGW